jgi:hypothetical protein
MARLQSQAERSRAEQTSLLGARSERLKISQFCRDLSKKARITCWTTTSRTIRRFSSARAGCQLYPAHPVAAVGRPFAAGLLVAESIPGEHSIQR